jgi:hypothetical protein
VCIIWSSTDVDSQRPRLRPYGGSRRQKNQEGVSRFLPQTPAYVCVRACVCVCVCVRACVEACTHAVTCSLARGRTHLHAYTGCLSGERKQQVKASEMYLDSTFYAVPEDFEEVKKKDKDDDEEEDDEVFV